jgi:lipopolysaccharide biosynthesis protein
MEQTSVTHIVGAGKISGPKVAILYHIFYEDAATSIVQELGDFNHFQVSFFFNISSDTPNKFQLKEDLLKHFPLATITISSNKGKDLGGKLLLLSLCLQLHHKPDWIIFLHDKKSLQALNAKTWKDELLKIIRVEEIQKIKDIISTDSGCGIIASKNYVRKELRADGQFSGNNGPLLTRLLHDYELVCNNYQYVAGTMFWAKASALMEFFSKYDPLKIRQTLEEGNVVDNFNGTHTHSWERLLSWIVTSKGLNIKTL